MIIVTSESNATVQASAVSHFAVFTLDTGFCEILECDTYFLFAYFRFLILKNQNTIWIYIFQMPFQVVNEAIMFHFVCFA